MLHFVNEHAKSGFTVRIFYDILRRKREREKEPRKLERHSHGEEATMPSRILIHPIQRTQPLSQTPLLMINCRKHLLQTSNYNLKSEKPKPIQLNQERESKIEKRHKLGKEGAR